MTTDPETYTIPDGRVLRLVHIGYEVLDELGRHSCSFCMTEREGEDPKLCSDLPRCTGPKAWMDDEAWAKYVAEVRMK